MWFRRETMWFCGGDEFLGVGDAMGSAEIVHFRGQFALSVADFEPRRGFVVRIWHVTMRRSRGKEKSRRETELFCRCAEFFRRCAELLHRRCAQFRGGAMQLRGDFGFAGGATSKITAHTARHGRRACRLDER